MCPNNSEHRSHTGSRGRACANFGTILSTDPEAPLCARLNHRLSYTTSLGAHALAPYVERMGQQVLSWRLIVL